MSQMMSIPCLAEVFVLREDSRGNIIRLLKLPRQVADELQKHDPKNSFFLAQSFKQYLAKDSRYKPKNDQEMLQQFGWWWGDDVWLDDDTGKPFGGPGEYKVDPNTGELFGVETHKIGKSISDVLKKNQKDTEVIKKEFPQGVEDRHEIEHTLRDIHLVRKSKKNVDPEKLSGRHAVDNPDGSFWMQLASGDCEGGMMGHCATDSDFAAGQMYSLRDKDGVPHVTLTLEEKFIWQIKGRQNRPPVRKYWPVIKNFVKKFHVKAINTFSEYGFDQPELVKFLGIREMTDAEKEYEG